MDWMLSEEEEEELGQVSDDCTRELDLEFAVQWALVYVLLLTSYWLHTLRQLIPTPQLKIRMTLVNQCNDTAKIHISE